MSGRLGVIGGAVAVSLVAGVGIAVAATASRVTVSRVVDGDTIVAKVNGREEFVRLLNVDAPETKDPDSPIECLGPEASRFLESRLPPGTVIRLEFDKERRDRYGRLLAGVFESDSLVNAEIAANGLGVAVRFAPNSRFFAEVSSAQVSASQAQVGFYDPEVPCSFPANATQIIEELQDSVAATEPAALDPMIVVAELDGVISKAERAWRANLIVAKGAGVKTLADEDARVAAALDEARSVRNRTVDEARKAEFKREEERRAHEAKLAEEQRLAEEARLAEASRLEAKRLEEEQAAENARRANEKRAADSKRVSAAKPASPTPVKKATKPSAKPTSAKPKGEQTTKKTTKKKPTAKTSSTPSKYTGPRCYAPGGKTWKPCPNR